MTRIERIKKILTDNLKPYHLIILDKSKEHINHNMFDGLNETHLYLEIGSKLFNKNKVGIHRKINSLILQEYKKGLHALEIRIINF